VADKRCRNKLGEYEDLVKEKYDLMEGVIDEIIEGLGLRD
jgi:hypothetical protein